jgi:hypothetical protein
MALIILRPTNLHWINDAADNPSDLCAHSPVEFRVEGDTLIRPSDGDWTVSAAALYLLRTLSQPHKKAGGIGDQLFPCCGNGIFEVEGQDDVLIVGCNSGIDFEVVQIGDEVHLTAADGTEHRVAMSDWRSAVCKFSDAVQAFYAGSSPKQPEDEFERRSFQKFMAEWSRRRSAGVEAPLDGQT